MRLRIAIASDGFSQPGGTQNYIRAIGPRFVAAGHSVMYWREHGAESTFSDLKAWSPDVIFSQGLSDPQWEERLLEIAPTFLIAHGYYGSCISGEKTMKFPTPTPCSRRFGAACLAHYFPRRCGGWNPVTMAKLYRLQDHRRRLLALFTGVITLSDHMRREVSPLVGDARRVHYIPFLPETVRCPIPLPGYATSAWRLIYFGRFHDLKGGQVLLRALPAIASGTRHPIELALIGDGPHRTAWERLAQKIETANKGIQIRFRSWMPSEALHAALRAAHLAVFPSMWPEPFGLAGIEALALGVPVVAFDAGAVGEWLKEGRNGHLAEGKPPSVSGLASAICHVFQSKEHFEKLREGAAQTAAQLKKGDNHVDGLVRIFCSVVKGASHARASS